MKTKLRKILLGVTLFGVAALGMGNVTKASDVAVQNPVPIVVQSNEQLPVPTVAPAPDAGSQPAPVVTDTNPVITEGNGGNVEEAPLSGADPDNLLLTLTENNGSFTWRVTGITAKDIYFFKILIGDLEYTYQTPALTGTVSKAQILNFIKGHPDVSGDFTGTFHIYVNSADEESIKDIEIYHFGPESFDIIGADLPLYDVSPSFGYYGDRGTITFYSKDYYVTFWDGTINEGTATSAQFCFSDDMAVKAYVVSSVSDILIDDVEYLFSGVPLSDIGVYVLSAEDKRLPGEVKWTATMTNGSGGVVYDDDDETIRIQGLLASGKTSGELVLTAKIADKNVAGGYFTKIFRIPVISGRLTSLTINGQASVSQGSTSIYTVSGSPAASYDKIVWDVIDSAPDPATITEKGVLKVPVDSSSTTSRTITITATAYYKDMPLEPIAKKTVTIGKFIAATGIKLSDVRITEGHTVYLPDPILTPKNASLEATYWDVKNIGEYEAEVDLDEGTITDVTEKGSAAGINTAKILVSTVPDPVEGDLYARSNVYVYSLPSASYKNKAITASVPKYVAVGDPQDDMEVKGYYLEAIYNGSAIANTGNSYITSGTGSSVSIDSSKIQSMFSNLNTDSYPDSFDVSFRLYPANGSNHTKNIYADTDEKATIYKVSVEAGTGVSSVGSPSGSSSSKVYAYGLDGQSITFGSALADGYKSPFVWKPSSGGSSSDSSSSHSVKISTSTNANKYTVTAASSSSSSSSSSSKSSTSSTSGTGSNASGGSGGSNASGYDKVPKTGQSNFFRIMLIVMLISGAGVVFYMTRTMRRVTTDGIEIDDTDYETADSFVASVEEMVVTEEAVETETVDEVFEETIEETISEEEFFDEEDDDKRNIFGDKIIDTSEDDYYFD